MNPGNDQSEKQLEFENLLQRAKELTLSELHSLKSPESLSGTQFETLVYEQVKKASVGTSFENNIVPTKNRAFPDIVASRVFGIEVKATEKDNWTSIGNSVLESSRESGVEKIYIFFGKLGGEPDILYRDYEMCLTGIAVTHYPRYQIDMKLAPGKSIFKKMHTSYDVMRHSANPIHTVKDYYRSQLKEGQSLWWIDDDSDRTPALSPIIKHFGELKVSSQNALKAETFVLFPEIFSQKVTKYERVAAHWASTHGLVSSHLRDHFTGGGRIQVMIDSKKLSLPKMIFKLVEVAGDVEKQLKICDETVLSSHWQKEIDNFVNAKSAWLKEVNEQSEWMDLPIKVSEIYEASLKDEIKIG